MLQRDDKELETVVTEMVKTGMIPELFEQWSSVKEHLEGLIELLGAACTRTFIVLERIGYSRDKPSPECTDSGGRYNCTFGKIDSASRALEAAHV